MFDIDFWINFWVNFGAIGLFIIAFIESITKKPTGGFPKVFADGVFVGGYAETKKYVSNRLVFDDNCEF